MSVPNHIKNVLGDMQPEDLAATWIPKLKEERISKERIAHMHTVAELMHRYFYAFDCKYLMRQEAYLLGLVHDIGYVDGKAMHEYRGADLLGQFTPNILSECIRWHGLTPQEYLKMKTCGPYDIPRELVLLWWADAMVKAGGEHAGEIVGYEKRLQRVKERWGEDSPPYNSLKDTIEWLEKNFPADFLARIDM